MHDFPHYFLSIGLDYLLLKDLMSPVMVTTFLKAITPDISLGLEPDHHELYVL